MFLIISSTTKANIYWLYEFYNISSNFNIFSLNDNEYQQCLKEKLSENDYKKAVEFKSSITQKMEDAADQCVEILLISQSNKELQICLQNELSNQSYNNLITKQFPKVLEKMILRYFINVFLNSKQILLLQVMSNIMNLIHVLRDTN